MFLFVIFFAAFCHNRESLPTLCSLITGDALLYSMFRENAAPVPCPFRGPFTFTYNRGHGECRSPVSSIDTCTEDSRLLLSYQACPDVHASESAGKNEDTVIYLYRKRRIVRKWTAEVVRAKSRDSFSFPVKGLSVRLDCWGWVLTAHRKWSVSI